MNLKVGPFYQSSALWSGPYIPCHDCSAAHFSNMNSCFVCTAHACGEHANHRLNLVLNDHVLSAFVLVCSSFLSDCTWSNWTGHLVSWCRRCTNLSAQNCAACDKSDRILPRWRNLCPLALRQPQTESGKSRGQRHSKMDVGNFLYASSKVIAITGDDRFH